MSLQGTDSYTNAVNRLAEQKDKTLTLYRLKTAKPKKGNTSWSANVRPSATPLYSPLYTDHVNRAKRKQLKKPTSLLDDDEDGDVEIISLMSPVDVVFNTNMSRVSAEVQVGSVNSRNPREAKGGRKFTRNSKPNQESQLPKGSNSHLDRIALDSQSNRTKSVDTSHGLYQRKSSNNANVKGNGNTQERRTESVWKQGHDYESASVASGETGPPGVPRWFFGSTAHSTVASPVPDLRTYSEKEAHPDGQSRYSWIDDIISLGEDATSHPATKFPGINITDSHSPLHKDHASWTTLPMQSDLEKYLHYLNNNKGVNHTFTKYVGPMEPGKYRSGGPISRPKENYVSTYERQKNRFGDSLHSKSSVKSLMQQQEDVNNKNNKLKSMLQK